MRRPGESGQEFTSSGHGESQVLTVVDGRVDETPPLETEGVMVVLVQLLIQNANGPGLDRCKGWPSS